MSKQIVFLSHSSKDKKQLIPFRKALEERTNGTIQFFLSSDGESIPYGHWIDCQRMPSFDMFIIFE